MVGIVTKNTLFLFLAQTGAKIISFLYLLFLARSLLVMSFGQYIFATTFLYFFVALAEFGLDRLVLRDVSRFPQEKQKYLGNILGLRLLLAGGAYFAAALLVKIFGYSQAHYLNVLIVGLSLFPQTLSQAYTSLFNAQERMEFSGVINFLMALFTAIFGFLLVGFYGLMGALVALSLGLSFSLLVGIYFGRKVEVRLSFQFDLSFWRQLVGQAWPFALLAIFALLYLRINIAILTRLTDDYTTGLYGSAFKLVELGVILPQSLTLALFPSFSRLMVANLEKLRKIYLQGIVVLFLASLPLFIFVAIFSQPIINLLYGGEYLKAAPALFILSFSLPFFFVNALPANIILNSQRIKSFLPLEVLKIVINASFCLVLIPRYSFLGAAWAMVISEGFGFLINNLFVYNVLKSERK